MNSLMSIILVIVMAFSMVGGIAPTEGTVSFDAKVNVDANLKVIWKADPYNAHLMDCRASDVLTDATLIITELSHSRNSEKKTEE